MVIAGAASDKKAIDIITIGMRKMSSVCDYFVIASGTSTTHVRAISDHIERKLKEKGEKLRHIEGQREASWILIDSGDVVSHIFLEETRRFYDLEGLWSDAPQMRFEEPGRGKSALKPGKSRQAAKKRKPAKKIAKKNVKKTRSK